MGLAKVENFVSSFSPFLNFSSLMGHDENVLNEGRPMADSNIASKSKPTAGQQNDRPEGQKADIPATLPIDDFIKIM